MSKIQGLSKTFSTVIEPNKLFVRVEVVIWHGHFRSPMYYVCKRIKINFSITLYASGVLICNFDFKLVPYHKMIYLCYVDSSLKVQSYDVVLLIFILNHIVVLYVGII